MYYTLSPLIYILNAVLTIDFIASSSILTLYSKVSPYFYNYHSVNQIKNSSEVYIPVKLQAPPLYPPASPPFAVRLPFAPAVTTY